jgi:hypothetical protein
MRVFGKAAVLFGAVALMGGIIVAQADYQQSWQEGALAQTPTMAVSEATRPLPAGSINCV